VAVHKNKTVVVHADAREVFRQALRFYYAQHVLTQSLGAWVIQQGPISQEELSDGTTQFTFGGMDRIPLVPPVVVCTALCLELGLKCMLRLSGQPIIHTHDLARLYRGLRPHWRSRIKRLYKEELRRPEWRKALRDRVLSPYVAVTLKRSAAIFVQWRYYFEGDAADSAVESVNRAIVAAILEVKPEWEADVQSMRLQPTVP
jgi:hypothetical protein